jgi:hypothetical protein
MTKYEEFGNYLDSKEESFSIKFEKIEEIFVGPNCLVGYQTKKDGRITTFKAKELIPTINLKLKTLQRFFLLQ